jgi:sterol-4alpha-carboxylate 3-dehydrogenase (decarboxylating)
MSAPNNERKVLGRVLVVGGCGFFGSHTVDILCFECDAIVFTLSCNSTREPHKLPGVQYFDADILSVTELLPIFEQVKPDVVINTVSPPSSSSSAALFQRVNVEGAECLLEASIKTGVKAFVYTSSSTVIKRHPSMALPNTDETWPVITGPAQKDAYLRSKARILP